MQPIHNKLTDGLRIGADNIERFAEVDIFNHCVHQEGFDHKAQNRVKPYLNPKGEKRGCHNQRVSEKQRPADINTGVLFQQHGHNIGAAA